MFSWLGNDWMHLARTLIWRVSTDNPLFSCYNLAHRASWLLVHHVGLHIGVATMYHLMMTLHWVMLVISDGFHCSIFSILLQFCICYLTFHQNRFGLDLEYLSSKRNKCFPFLQTLENHNHSIFNLVLLDLGKIDHGQNPQSMEMI